MNADGMTAAQVRVALDGIEALADNIRNYDVTPWDSGEAVGDRAGYMATLDGLRAAFLSATRRTRTEPACVGCGGYLGGATATRTGHCVLCATEACAIGDGERVGLPTPGDMDGALRAVERHLGECTVGDRATCPVCAFGSGTCGECGEHSDDMTAEARAAHMTCGRLVVVGCEGYATPIARAAWVAA